MNPSAPALFDRFPALRSYPRAALCEFPSPVERVILPGGAELWIKREDLNAPICGGNKARSLELLLGGVRAGDTILTVGGAGSTHVLATAIHGARLGARTVAIRWRHDMNAIAEAVSARITAAADSRTFPLSALALAAALPRRIRRDGRYVPLGGSTPLAVLAQAGAALELARQVREGALPAPARIVLPLGSGGTAAGLILGLAFTELETIVCGARVAPHIAANRWRVFSLASRAARLLERATGEKSPDIPRHRLVVVHDAFGGAYGRPLARAKPLIEWAATQGLILDDTYSAKAFVVAAALAAEAKGPTLFWMTFDSRWMRDSA